MPTYEKRDADGTVLERSVTFLGTPHDLQLSHAADNQDSPWHLVDEHGEPAQAATDPVFVEPAPVDTPVDTPPAESAPVEESAQADDHTEQDIEPDASGDDTEE